MGGGEQLPTQSLTLFLNTSTHKKCFLLGASRGPSTEQFVTRYRKLRGGDSKGGKDFEKNINSLCSKFKIGKKFISVVSGALAKLFHEPNHAASQVRLLSLQFKDGYANAELNALSRKKCCDDHEVSLPSSHAVG